MPVSSFDYNLILLLAFVPYLLRETTSFSASEIMLLCLALVPKTFITINLEPYQTQFGPTFLAYHGAGGSYTSISDRAPGSGSTLPGRSGKPFSVD